MNGVQALKESLTSTRDLLNWYVADLADADLTVRPAATANNIAWQIGHLIMAESGLLGGLPGAVYPELPKAMLEYTRENAQATPAGGYLPKDHYVEWFNKMRAATIDNLARLSDADLDLPSTGPMAKFAPTAGAMIVLVCNHTLMHAGQFTVVRRALGKPILF